MFIPIHVESWSILFLDQIDPKFYVKTWIWRHFWPAKYFIRCLTFYLDSIQSGLPKLHRVQTVAMIMTQKWPARSSFLRVCICRVDNRHNKLNHDIFSNALVKFNSFRFHWYHISGLKTMIKHFGQGILVYDSLRRGRWAMNHGQILPKMTILEHWVSHDWMSNKIFNSIQPRVIN